MIIASVGDECGEEPGARLGWEATWPPSPNQFVNLAAVSGRQVGGFTHFIWLLFDDVGDAMAVGNGWNAKGVLVERVSSAQYSQVLGFEIGFWTGGLYMMLGLATTRSGPLSVYPMRSCLGVRIGLTVRDE